MDVNQIIGEIVKNRQEIKNAIEESEIKVLLKVEELMRKVKSLEEENISLKQKVEYLERKSKKNNIIIFGLDSEDATLPNICRKLKDLIRVDISVNDINNFYPLNSTTNNALKIEFTSFWKKLKVLGNCKYLKGTSVTVVNDLTFEQRRDQKVLRHHLAIARKENKISYIRSEKLFIGNKVYTVEDLKIQEIPIHQGNNKSPTPKETNNEKTVIENSSGTPNIRNNNSQTRETKQSPSTRTRSVKNIGTTHTKTAENRTSRLRFGRN